MNAELIRQKFLAFFQRHDHTIVESSSVIPAQDPTILFANAGMNQFKDCFLGTEKRSYVRATSSQKCIRAGGKHNDLENVGFTSRHLTFFEMLGNFSFGDYFKKEAIDFAWRFLTEDLAIPKERLYVTVFEKDDEAYELWHTVANVPYEQISRLGEKDNFWSMGETGPCGPCTEIYYDRGESFGTGPENQAPGGEGERFIEVWNLVFMQYNRAADGTLSPLAQTGVDTGMGLERIAAVLQEKKTVFHIDLFKPLIASIEKMSGVNYVTASPETQAAFHVLCDHIRSTSFIIADGGAPSNEGRGYVLRKIIRRAALFSQKLHEQPFFHKLVEPLIQCMAGAYPELETNKTLIESVLTSEVEKFSNNLLVGKNIFAKYVEQLKTENKSELSGAQAFKLYDTYGFPLELTKVLAYEEHITIDEAGFEKEMEQQQALSGKKNKAENTLTIPTTVTTDFVGYEILTCSSPLLWFSKNDDQTAWIVTQESPFYVESGGQVNDQGTITIDGIELTVTDLKKIVTQPNKFAIAALCELPNNFPVDALQINKEVTCTVNALTRMNTVRNHTATHMLQAALIEVLGPTVKQAGSVVEPEYLRFDFSFQRPMTDEEIKKTEDIINRKIQENISTTIVNTTLKDAEERGAKAFFGEKYNPESVRVVSIPGFSTELCGGTHAPSTGIIGAFKIMSEASLATGVRRIVAITGPAVIELLQNLYSTARTLSEQFKVQINEIGPAVQKQQESLMDALQELKQMKKKMVLTQVPEWIDQIKDLGGIPTAQIHLEDGTNDDVKIISQKVFEKKPALLIITSLNKDRLFYYLALHPSLTQSCDLKGIQKELMAQLPVKGGGNNTLVQGSGTVPKDQLLATITQMLEK